MVDEWIDRSIDRSLVCLLAGWLVSSGVLVLQCVVLILVGKDTRKTNERIYSGLVWFGLVWFGLYYIIYTETDTRW